MEIGNMTEWLLLLAEADTIIIGSSILGGGAIVGILTKYISRQINKVDEHIDNRKIHLDPNNGYVRMSACQLMQENLSIANTAEHKKILGILDAHEKRFDNLEAKIEDVKSCQDASTTRIIDAIKDIKDDKEK